MYAFRICARRIKGLAVENDKKSLRLCMCTGHLEIVVCIGQEGKERETPFFPVGMLPAYLLASGDLFRFEMAYDPLQQKSRKLLNM